MRRPDGRWLLLALTFVAAVAAASAASAQINVQVSGMIESIEGPVLVLRTTPPPTPRVTFGTRPSPTPAPPSRLVVDLDDVPASQWVFLRPGERVSVVGLPSADGRRFAAVAVIGGSGPPSQRETPQAP